MSSVNIEQAQYFDKKRLKFTLSIKIVNNMKMQYFFFF